MDEGVHSLAFIERHIQPSGYLYHHLDYSCVIATTTTTTIRIFVSTCLYRVSFYNISINYICCLLFLLRDIYSL